MSKVVIVSIEGLGTNLVGCYGGSIGPTKNWDHFACRAIVFDQFWSDTLLPIDVLESMWSGIHFATRHSNPTIGVPKSATELFGRALLVTDSMAVIEQMTFDFFADVMFVDSRTEETSEADSAGEADEDSEADSAGEATTQFTKLLEAALGRWASSLDEFPVLWIHSQGLNGQWDAPYEFRSIMCDEGDPDPPRETEPAQLKLELDTDPDEVFGMACSAGGQAIAMDEAWGMIEEILEELGIADDCLQVLAGVCGYPMGEHGWVGHGAKSLHAETLHLPLIIRPANRLELGIRVPFMVQPHSLQKTIASWLEMGFKDADSMGRGMDLVLETGALPADQWPIENQLAYSCFEDQVHVSVPAWSCLWSTLENGSKQIELYAMPDDRWEQNEVSQRALPIVEMMTEQRNKWLSYATKKDSILESLQSELTHPLR